VSADTPTSNSFVVVCNASGLAADATTVDALARLQLAARRRGWQVRMRDASAELLGLIALMGLEDVLPESAAGDDFLRAIASNVCNRRTRRWNRCRR